MKRNGFGTRAGLAAAAVVWLLLGSVAAGAAEPPRPRVAFDRPGGFTVRQGEAAAVTATLQGGSGGMWFHWEGNNPGTTTGDGGATFEIDTGAPGEYWLRATGGSDGTDGDFSGKIRFRVAEAEGPARGTRAAGAGETTLLSEDFSGMTTAGSATVSEYNGWTGTKLYNGTNCLKIGSSSATGNALSPVVTNAGASGRVEYSLRKYGSDSTTVEVSCSTDGGTSWTSLANHSSMPSSATSYSAEFGASQTVQFKWQGTGKRFHLGPVAVYATVPEPEENQPPTIDLAPDATAVEVILGETYSLEVTATEFDGDVVTLDASGLPDGAVWVPGDPASGTVQGLFEWTPAATGTWTAVFSAFDKDGTNTATVAFSAVPEGPGRLSFESAAVNARESSGSVELRVLRTGGAAGAVGVAWATMDGTAAAGSEYVAGGGLASFADGQTEATVTVELLDDASPESSKAFTVVLGNVTGGAEAGDITTCTVTIIDDDDANAGYYANCYKNGMLKTGDELKNALCQIINTGVTTNNYNTLDTIFRVTDACPTNHNQVQCIYLQRGISSFNKEHIWAQSHEIDGNAPGYSDLHHIRASDSTMNSKRGNLDFDNCQGKSGAVEYNGCYYISNKAWEPPDSAKGDVARAMLYMDVRYENKYNSKYDLELVDTIPTTTTGNQLGKLSTLLAWNELDPVDAFETNRNELIYTTYQGNRNPFIDHPDWARAVFDPDNYVPAVVVWTVSGTVEGLGWVNGADGAFSAEVTNGLTKTFFVQPDASSRYHIGSISWNGTLVPQAYYTNAAYYNYTTPAVTNNSTLAVVFAPDLAALGTPIPWLAQYGTNAASVAQENWDAAELEDWNDDGVANWEEYLAGNDPTAFRLRQVTGVTVGGETTDGFTVGWTAVANAEEYRVRVCSTAVVEAATAGFEGGEVDSGWTVSETGAAAVTGGAMDGTYGLSLSAAEAWVCSPVVESPVSVEFQYKRSSSTAEWALAVEVGEEGGGSWQTVATVTDATTVAQTASVELPGWRGRRASVRLRDARTGGSTARYVDSVTVRTSGATVAEGTTAGTTWTATGLADGTGYDVYVRGEATTPEEAAGPWSEAVRATTAEIVDTRAEQSISFPEIADQTVGATVVLGATASSGLAVEYAVSGPATIAGTTLTCTGAGTVTVTASQAGDADWKPAESVTRTFEVAALVLDAPENAWASATNAAGFTAEWSAVAGATGYELEVWKDGTGEDGGTEIETVLLSTDFASINGNGNTTLTNGFIEGWTCVKAYGGTNEIRVGASSALGWVKAPETGATGTVQVVTRARAWSGDSNVMLWVGVTGCASQENTLSAESAVFTNVFENVAGAVTVCWSNATASKQRFFLEEVSVTELSAGAGGGGGAVPVAGYDPLAVTGTSWAVTGLEAATAYGFHVRATAGTAEGMWSDAVGVTTLAADGGKLPQSISFPEISTQIATNTLMLGATASSGLPVVYTVTGNAVETNGILSFTGAGTVTVTASQPGNEAWDAAASVTRTFAVEKAEQDIDFAQIQGTVEETATVALSATADSGLPVTFRVEEGPAVLDAATGTLTFTGTGTVEVTARQEGNALWEAALPAWQTFQVVGVELPAPAAAWASVTNEAGFTAVWSPVAEATGYELTVWRVTEAGEGGEESATVLVADICPDISGNGNDRLNNGNPAGWVYTNAYAATNEIRVGTSGAAGSATVTGVGATGTVRVVTRARKWAADSAVEMRVAVGGAVQTNAVESASATFTNDFEGVEGEVAVMWSGAGSRKRFFLESVEVSVIGAGGSGGVVREVVPGYDGLAVAGTEQAVTGLEAETAYEFQVRAVAGTTPGAGSEVVPVTTLAAESAKQAQSIVFPEIGAQVATNTVVLGATASSGLAVSYTVEGPATLAGNVLTFTGAGTVSVTASQAGNDEWAPAADVTWTFVVVKAAQSIDFPALAGLSVGDTVTLNAAASSGLTMSYTVSGPATLEDGVLTCTGAGTVTVTAAQNGNDFYEAATPVERSFVVSLVPQTIDFAAIGNQTATATVPLSATASSGLDVSFAVTGGPAEVNGSTLTFTGAGEVTVTATQAGNEIYTSASASQTFTVSKASQNIDFPALAGQSVGDTLTLTATASSGLTVSYTVTGPATLNGTTLTCTEAGTVTVTASQDGNALYDAATPVVQSFEVSLLSQAIEFDAIGDQVATNTVTLSATATSGLDVTFTVESGPAVLDGSTLTFTGAGEVTVTATQAGNEIYTSASASQTFTVAKASQSIDFPALTSQSVGDTVTLTATASSSLTVSYTVTGPATLNGTTLTCTGAGTVTVTASQDGNALYDAATPVVHSFEVSLLSQAIEFDAIGDQVATNTVTLSATADSGLEVAFAVENGPAVLDGSTLTFTGAGEVTVTATQAGTKTYASATENQTFTVSKASQSIDFPALTSQSVGDTVTLNATASSGLTVSYTVIGPATLEGTTLTCTGAGTVTVTACQDGNAIYDAAPPVVQSFEVSLLSQTIEFDTIGDQVATSTVTLSATATSGLNVTFALTSGPAEVNGSTLTFMGAGEVTITVTQAGNEIYTSATATQTFTVSKASQSIDFPALTSQSVGDTVTLNAAASSGLIVSYTVSGPATLTGTSLSFTGAGTVTVTAHQAGNDLWAAASDVVQEFAVSLLEQTIDFPEIAAQVATNTVTLTATATSSLDVTFAVESGPAVVEGNTLTFTGAGTVVVIASQSGGGNYAAAADVTRTFEVALATQKITFGAIADQSVTNTLSLEAVASSGLEVSYTVNGPATLTGTTLSFTGAGTVTVTAHQAGNDLWAAASDVVQEFAVSLLGQSIDFPEIGAQVATNTETLTATASSGLEVAFAVASGPAVVEGNTLTFTGAGEVTVKATQAGNGTYAAASATQTFTVAKASQSIDFPALTSQSVGDTVTLNATASSELAVSYTVSGPATLEGTTLTCTGAGTVTATACQDGNAIYDAAPPVEHSFEVSLLTQTIEFDAIDDQVATNVVTLSATATSGLDVTFAVTSGPAVLEGNTLTFTGVGTVVIVASQSGGGNYAAALDVAQEFEVTLAAQSITFGAIADQHVTDTVRLAATASSGLEVSYTVSGPATLSGTTLSFTGAGTVTVTAHQPGNDLWAAASDVVQEFAVSLLEQSIDFPEIAAQVATNTVTLSATATSGLDVTFAVESGPAVVEGNTLTFTGAGTVVVVASQSGGGNYAAAEDVTRTFAVALASQEITFGTIADQSVTDTVTLEATASSGLEVSYTVSGPATLSGTTLSFTGAGTVTVTAHQAGNNLWAAAADVVQEFEVSLLEQTIDFPEIGAQVATNTVGLSATATSGLDVTFAVTSGPALVEGNTLTFTGAGTVVVVASQSGGGNYTAAADVARTFEVALATQEITFGAIADQHVTDTVTLAATASSGLEVSYTVSGPATLTGTSLSFTGAGTVTVTAHQTGNDLWAEAENVTRTFEVSLLVQTIEFDPIGDQVATNVVTLTATATSGLDVTFAVTSGPAVQDGSTLTFTGAGEVTVTATQAGNNTYASASATQTFTVAKASQSIDFPALTSQSVGDTVTLNAAASSGLSVSYTVIGPATLEGDTLTCTGEGTVTVTASQEGDDLYAAADDVVRTFDVEEAKTPEETAYEAWLRGLGLDAAAYPMGDTGANGHGNWQNYVWDIAPTNTLGLEITGLAAANGNLMLTVPMASERRNYVWVWWTALETGKNPLDDATEVPLGPGAPTMTIPNALPDGGFGLLQATIPE